MRGVSSRGLGGEDLRGRLGLWRGREGDLGGRNGGRCILERGGGRGSPSSSPSFLPPPPPSSPHSLPPLPPPGLVWSPAGGSRKSRTPILSSRWSSPSFLFPPPPPPSFLPVLPPSPPLRPLLYLLSLLPPDLARTPPSGGHPPKSGSKEWMFLTCAIPRQGITQVPFRWHKSDVQIHTFCSPLALCDADLRDPPAGDHTSARFR